MAGFDEALAGASTGVEGYAYDPTAVVVSQQMQDLITACAEVSPEGVDAGVVGEEGWSRLSGDAAALNNDAVTMRDAVNDHALPGLRAMAAEAAASSSPSAALAAPAGSGEQMLAQARDMFLSIDSAVDGVPGPDGDDSGDSGDEEKSAPALGGGDDAEDATDGASPDDASAPTVGGESPAPADVATQVSAAAPMMPGQVPVGASAGALPTLGSLLTGSAPAMASGMAPGMAPVTAPSTGSAGAAGGSSGGISRTDLKSMIDEAKQRLAARHAGDAKPSETPATPKPTETPATPKSPGKSVDPGSVSTRTTHQAPATPSGPGSGPTGPSGSSAPAAPATGSTVHGGVGSGESSGTARSPQTTLSASTAGSSSGGSSGAAPRGGLGGMGMMPPMGGGAGAAAGGAGSTSTRRKLLDEMRAGSPVFTGEWARTAGVAGGVVTGHGSGTLIDDPDATFVSGVPVSPAGRDVPAPAEDDDTMVELSVIDKWVK
jgi:hypothetical protein